MGRSTKKKKVRFLAGSRDEALAFAKGCVWEGRSTTRRPVLHTTRGRLCSPRGTENLGPNPPPRATAGLQAPSRPQAPPRRNPGIPTKSLPWRRVKKVALPKTPRREARGPRQVRPPKAGGRRRTGSGNTQILSARAARPQERGVSDHAGGDTSSTSSIRPRPQGALCFDRTVYVTFMNSGTGDSDIHLFQTMKLPENLGSPAPGPAGLREMAVYEELPASERWEAL